LTLVELSDFDFIFEASSRTSTSGTNRVKRHGGKAMRAMQAKNVYLFPFQFLGDNKSLVPSNLCYHAKFKIN
jgi:hypothetical protein